MGRRTLRIDYGELPVVQRDHYAAPHLVDDQVSTALRDVLQLQQSASRLEPQHARAHTDALRRRRVIRLSLVTFGLELAAGIAVVGHVLGWWPA
jgi:hypothetical protein